MPPILAVTIAALKTSDSFKLAAVSFALVGLVGWAVHRAIKKRSQQSGSTQRFDSTGVSMFLGIVLIPAGVILWVILQAIVQMMND